MTVDKGWGEYWKNNPAGFNDIMRQSTIFFAKRYLKLKPLDSNDTILDYGCGPGYLIDYLKKTDATFHGMDISEIYIKSCIEEFKENGNITFSKTNSYDFGELESVIIDKKIKSVVILSILQYYQKMANVENLLKSLKKVAVHQPFDCVIADIIPSDHSFLKDVGSIIKNAVKDHYTIKFIKFIFYALLSDYRKAKKNGFLIIDFSDLETICKRENIQIKKIENLTIHSSRYSVQLKF